jgi:hypothetical protein
VTAKVTWSQALAWRLERQLIDPVGSLSVHDVVSRLGGVQAQVASVAELAIRLRQQTSRPGAVAAAVSSGRLVKTWAMRGTLHLLAPDDAGAFLALMAAGRTWERPSWQRYFGMSNRTWELFRAAVQDLLAGGAILTREELGAAVTARRGLAHIGQELQSGWGTLLKPLAWQGDLCFGPSRGNRVTFAAPSTVSGSWSGVPSPEEAAPRAIETYLRAYGPADVGAFGNWISRGRISARLLRGWFAAMGDRLAEVDVEGDRLLVVADDLAALVAARPASGVRLVAGFDGWVLGPGTEDTHVVPARRRRDVSRQSGWIAPVVLRGGVVAGTWKLESASVAVTWFGEAGRVPRAGLRAEVGRLAKIAATPLTLAVDPG